MTAFENVKKGKGLAIAHGVDNLELYQSKDNLTSDRSSPCHGPGQEGHAVVEKVRNNDADTDAEHLG